MNIENVNKAIAVMKRVKKRGDAFYLGTWQGLSMDEDALTNEEELHSCGTSACFAGWVAVSPEFKEDGGGIDEDGSPTWLGSRFVSGTAAIGAWLDLGGEQAYDLCGCGETRRVYGVDDHEVTVDNVLAALYRLRDTGTVYPPKN